jgi:hypothetical protein
MSFLIRLSTVVLLALVTLVSSVALAKSEGTDRGGFTAADNEFYLTEEVFYFFRPGVEFELINFEIPSDRLPLVTFSLKDPMGMPLDREGVFTPGEIDVRMMLTYIPQGEENKISYHPRSRDRNGTYTSEGDGVYTYKFSDQLPENYDADATHTLGVVTARDLRDYDLERYYDNDVHNFVPSGAEMVTPPRDIVRTETCNRCHDPLGEHGGRYQEVQICQQCHLPALVDDDGVSYSMNVMIHRVHAAAAEYPAPLNDCEVCHTGGTPTADFPLVANPNPTPTCDGSGLGMTELSWADAGSVQVRVNSEDGPLFASASGAGSKMTGKWTRDGMQFFLVDTASGEVIQRVNQDLTVFGCANNAPGAFKGEVADLHTRWLNRPSREVCSACHVDVDFESGDNHPVQETDETCYFCHTPTGREFGASISGAHTVDYQSAQLGGVLVEIVDIQNTGPGERPTVTFALRNKFGAMSPSELGRLRFSLSGPNDDFSFYAQDDAMGKLTPSGPNWVFEFDTPLPDDAMGSFSLGVEGRINNVVLNPGANDEFTMNDQMQNFIEPFAVTGDMVSPRRMVVDDAKCESCHSNLSLHGENRHDAGGYCQTCHMPSATDEQVREEGDTPQSIDFRYMVHKIHRGEDLENGYVVLGFRSSVHDYSHVVYPGDLRNCEACHVDDSYTLPLSSSLESVETPRDYFTPMGPESAACLSCHDTKSAAAHAVSNSNEIGEACASCHGVGKTYAVEKLHAR